MSLIGATFRKGQIMKRIGLIGVLALGVAGVVLAGDKPTAQKPPVAAIAPLKRFDSAVGVADQDWRRSVDKAKGALVGDLKAAQKVALERNQLDDATAIAELIKSYSVQSEPSYIGKPFNVDGGKVLILNRDGSVKISSGETGRWFDLGEQRLFICWDHGYCDLWKFDSLRSIHSITFKREREYDGSMK